MKYGIIGSAAYILLCSMESIVPCQSFSGSLHRPLGASSSLLKMSEGGVESVSLESLGDDYEVMGTELAGSVQRWLDAEWMPQEIHARMGESCKRTYVQCREENVADLMSIMMQVADDLQESWQEYDSEAFVNPYDVSNYVSDFFTTKVVGETCECVSKIH